MVVGIEFLENTPCFTNPTNPIGSAVARFEINLDHEHATCLCITDGGAATGLTPDPCNPDDSSVEIEIDDGALDLTNADTSD